MRVPIDRASEAAALCRQKRTVIQSDCKLVQHVFDGSARRLVAHLIEEGELDDRERDEILEILKARKDKDKKPSPKKKGTNP